MQLRLELAESPAPAVALWELVGEQQRQTAMTLLAALIAQTVAPEAAGDDRVPVRRRWRGWMGRTSEVGSAAASLQLVTVCLTDEGAGEISDEHGRADRAGTAGARASAPGEARELAFCLLELAELAERRSELTR